MTKEAKWRLMCNWGTHNSRVSSHRARLVNEVVVEVIEGCRRRGAPADPATVRMLVEREWAGFAGARVQSFLPVLVARAVRDQLHRNAG